MYHLRDVSSAYEIVRNDDQFKSLAILYNKHKFKCLEQKNFDAVIYIKFSTTLCNICNFSMLLFSRKSNSDVAQFVRYIIYLVITKHVDLILENFNKDSTGEGPIKKSLQSLDFFSTRFGSSTY